MPTTIYYFTGWEKCIVHGCPKGQGAWKDHLSEDAPEHPGWKKFTIDADGIEFVVTDERKVDWDKPPDWYGKPNYLIESGGTYSLFGGHLRQVRKSRCLVVSDLDHTMVGHERDPGDKLVEEFRHLWLGEFTLNGSCLVYSTGRNLKDAKAVACERCLPRPELLVCGVGTEVYKVPRELPLLGWWEAADGVLQLVPEWKADMELFQRAAAEAILAADFPKFELRGSPEHDPYRIPTAYEIDENWESNMANLRAALGPEYQVISSGEGAWKLVDVCSSKAGKLKAMEFAMKTLSFDPASTLACGDSGNDELMYRCKGARAVMVSNALSELVNALTAAAQPPVPELQRGTVFETCHGSTVLFSSREVAGGICEALTRFWPS